MLTKPKFSNTDAKFPVADADWEARLTPIKPARQPRRLGLLDSELQIPDDFNAPLPETLLNAFEGRG